MKLKQIASALVAASVVFLASPLFTSPVSAQNNVSCNAAYYKSQSYIDIVVPATGPTGTKPHIILWMDTSFDTRVILKKNGTTVATVDKGTITGKYHEYEANYGDTIRYELYMRLSSGTQPWPRWMPANVAPNRNKCGTGCHIEDNRYFAVVDETPLYNTAVADGSTPYNLNNSGYSLFLNSSRQQNTGDTAFTCWNDQPTQAGTADNDFNDMIALWTIKSVATTATTTPTASQTASPTATNTPTATPTKTTTKTPSVTHTPSDTGFADDILIYIGGALYVVGVIAFMGARIIGNQKKTK